MISLPHVMLLASTLLASAASDPGPRRQLGDSTIRDSTIRLSSGDWLLVGTYSTPAASGRSSPAVLLLNRANGNRHEYDALAAALASHGVASLRLDLRGHGESINRGRFEPAAAGMDQLLAGTGEDVVAGLRWLRARPETDTARLAVVGASYSGEIAVQALGMGPAPQLYALLSPGSLSSESVSRLDAHDRRWLLIASRQERSPATREVIAEVLAQSRQADVWLWQPAGHATQLLSIVPELPTLLATWLATQLTATNPATGR